MLGPNALCSRLFLGALTLTAGYFCYMNYILYARVQCYPVRRSSSNSSSENEYRSRISCDYNPICDVTVKGMMLDNPNHYLLSPLAAIANDVLGISRTKWISPNMISGLHVLVAVASGKCVSSNSLWQRRLGVLLFVARSWLDDLDGHVARVRKHVRGEHSDVGSIGYWVDGICDALGVASLIIGVFCFLKNNPSRRGYEKLVATIDSKDFEARPVHSKKRATWREIPRTVLLLVGQLNLASIGWNRYIAVYQDLLENDGDPTCSSCQTHLFDQQLRVFRSASFWTITLAWTLVNIHALTDYLLLAIFIDRVWEYLRFIRYIGYFVLLAIIGITELHFTIVSAYVNDPLAVTPAKADDDYLSRLDVLA